MEMTGRAKKKAKRPAVNRRPSMAFVGVGGMVPSTVRAMEDITRITNITKKRGLLRALLMGEKSKKGRSRRSKRIRLKATKPRNLSGIERNTV